MARNPDRQLILDSNRMQRGRAMSYIGLGAVALCIQSFGVSLALLRQVALSLKRCRANKAELLLWYLNAAAPGIVLAMARSRHVVRYFSIPCSLRLKT